MRTAIDNLAEQSLITSYEHSVATAAMDADTPEHITMGYELEVLSTAVDSAPKLRALRDLPPAQQYESDEVYERATELRNLGFKIFINQDDSSDGLYEVQSDPTPNALPLAVVTRGIARAGYIPTEADELQVNVHVSLGSPQIIAYERLQTHQFIRMLRVVEMLGGSSRERLTYGILHSSDQTQDWHIRGVGGVAIGHSQHTQWKDDRANRVEFRSLEYRDPLQFADMIERIYFMGRAILSDQPEVQSAYQSFDDWLVDYLGKHELPNIQSSTLDSYRFSKRKYDNLLYYLGKYAKHVEEKGTEELEAVTNSTIIELREAFGAPVIPRVDDLGPFRYKKRRLSLRSHSLPSSDSTRLKPAIAQA